MRVRILSGNLTGCVQDVPQIDGEVMVATGFAALVPDDPIAVAVTDDPTPAEPDGADADHGADD